MKTIIFSIIAVAAFSINMKGQETPADVKTPAFEIEPIQPIQPVIPADTIYQSEDQDTTIFRMGDQETEVIDDDFETDSKWWNHKNRRDQSGKFNGHWEGVELGFNSFDKPDYSMYNPADKDFMSLNQGKSMEFDINFYEMNIGLYKSYIGLVSGIGLSFNSYRFENPYTLRRESEFTQASPLDTENLSKTKLAVSYLQVPLLFEFQIPVNQREERVYINAGVVGGVKIGSHTKVKYGDDKQKDRSGFNMNSFKYAATVRIGYKDIGLFGTYSLTPLFESGKGPELTPFTIGISFLN